MIRAAALAVLLLAADLASAAGFAAAASPSRFVLQSKPGEVISRSVEIQHVGNESTEYVLRSADWTLTEERGLEFYDALQPGSCRQWLKLERRTVRMEARSRRRVRFEVHVPPEASPGECRFALLVENYEQRAMPLISSAPIQLPLTGRLGVVVYVAIGGAQPKLSMVEVTTGDDAGERVPMVTVRNDGNAHGRLDGALKGTDASGRSFFFPVSTLPVMPGQTRHLALIPAEDLQGKKRPKLTFPVKLSGRLDWEHGGFGVEAEVR